MPILPKLNLSRAVKLPPTSIITNEEVIDNDKLNVPNLKNQTNNEMTVGPSTSLPSSQHQISDDIPFIHEQLLSPSHYHSPRSISSTSDHGNNVEEEVPVVTPIITTNTISECDLRGNVDCSVSIRTSSSLSGSYPSSPIASIQDDNDTESLISDAKRIITSESLMTAPKKRRRTVNKIDQDPETLPLRDLLFYNPPETIFQKENRESHELEQQQSLSIQEQIDRSAAGGSSPKPLKRNLRSGSNNSRRSSTRSRSSSISSEQSQKGKLEKIPKEEEDTKKGNPDIKNEKTEVKKDSQENNNDEDDKDETGPMLTIDESGNIVLKNADDESKDGLSHHQKTITNKSTTLMKPSSTTYNSFRRKERTKNLWNAQDTGIFYNALELVGTDFTLMEAVFFKDLGRDRKQLKQKFKREEKMNRQYVDEILYKFLHNRSKIVVTGNVNTTTTSSNKTTPQKITMTTSDDNNNTKNVNLDDEIDKQE